MRLFVVVEVEPRRPYRARDAFLAVECRPRAYRIIGLWEVEEVEKLAGAMVRLVDRNIDLGSIQQKIASYQAGPWTGAPAWMRQHSTENCKSS